MADPLVAHDDLEMFLVNWYRAALADRPEEVCRDVEVGNSEPLPGAPFPKRLLVVRVDGGSDTSILTAERDVGLSVLAGTKEDPQDANGLARIVHALRTQIPAVAPGNPVAAVLRSSGPYPVPETQPRARRYIPLTLAVVGVPL
jgi:hypothetical protein